MSTAAEEHLTYTPPQVARMLGVSHEKVLNFIRSGELQACDLSTARNQRPRWYVRRIDLDKFLARRSCTPEPPQRRRRKRTDDSVIEFYQE